MYKLCSAFFMAMVLVTLPASASSQPAVLASIKPVAMLIKAVVGDQLAVDVLLGANISPHDYTLKFSDIRKVRNAALVVWVGPELEGVLVKSLTSVPVDKQLQLTGLASLQWPEESINGDEHEGGHKAHTRDPHLWLNPRNSLVAVEAIAATLIEKYPEKGRLFEKNTYEFIRKINEIDSINKERLGLVKENGFVVSHDGYGHFVDYYGLNQLATIQLAGGVAQGARHYGEIIAMGDKVTCIFSEPQLNNKSSMQLATQLDANRAELDLMGRDVALTKDSYLQFFSRFTETFTECLERK